MNMATPIFLFSEFSSISQKYYDYNFAFEHGVSYHENLIKKVCYL